MMGLRNKKESRVAEIQIKSDLEITICSPQQVCGNETQVFREWRQIDLIRPAASP